MNADRKFIYVMIYQKEKPQEGTIEVGTFA